MTVLTTLLFDLSEVLITGLFGVEKALARIVGETEEMIFPRLGGDRLDRLCRGEISEDEYLAEICEAEGWIANAEALKGAIRSNFHGRIDGMVELVEYLSQDYEVVLVSDHAREWIDYIERTHTFLQQFDRRVYSFETGRTKSEPTCFPALLELLGRTAEQCVFVDDRAVNVDQARRAGIRAVRFRGIEALTAEFQSLGILRSGAPFDR
jgi:FMN phosphatase YigB (HAD superfamily)